MKKTSIILIFLVMCTSVVHAKLLGPDGIGVWQLRTHLSICTTYTFFKSNTWKILSGDVNGAYDYKYGQLAMKQRVTISKNGKSKEIEKTIIAGSVKFRNDLMVVTGTQEWVFKRIDRVEEGKTIEALILDDGKTLSRNNKKVLETAKKTIDENIQKSTPTRTKADEIKIESIESEVVNEDYIKGNELQNQLQKFLGMYCRTFEKKNLTQLAGFFTADAKEKGKSFNSLWHKYRKNFKNMDKISYRIDLIDFFYQVDSESYEIQGIFYIKCLPYGTAWQKTSGRISMSLVDYDNSYRIRRLDYHVTI